MPYEQTFLEFLAEGTEDARFRDFQKMAGTNDRTIRDVLNRLMKAGLVEKDESAVRPVYRITAKGRRARRAHVTSAAFTQAITPPKVRKELLNQSLLHIHRAADGIDAVSDFAQLGGEYDAIGNTAIEVESLIYDLAESLGLIGDEEENWGGYAVTARSKVSPADEVGDCARELEKAIAEFVDLHGANLPDVSKYLEHQARRIKEEITALQGR